MTVDPIVIAFSRTLIVILAAALLLVGATVAVLRRRHPALAREIALRYASWVVMAGLVLGALALGRGVWIALVAVLSMAAFREYGRAVGLWPDRGFQGVVYLFIALMHACAWWPYTDASPELGWYGLFMAMPAYATAGILLVPIVRDRYQHMLQRTCLSLLGVVYFGWMLAHLAYLVNLPGGVGLVLLVIVLVALHDVAAFVIGRLIGRHPLRPTLSPRKTVEGTVGALGVVTIATWGFRWLVPAFTAPHLVAISMLITAGATLGDLALSFMKRDVGVKDWSATIPGHGGVLDRLNSLIFTAPLCFHYSRYFFT